jgi:uncharacterized repeat protein (TIGR01451 family)
MRANEPFYWIVFAMNKILSFCLLAACAVATSSVFAQGAVISTLTAQRVETEAGKVVLKPATASKPGDVIAYVGTYRNGGTAAANKLTAVIPVPTGTALVAGSTEPGAAQASTDGVRFEAMPLMRTVKAADGAERREAVPLADYRAVRWEIGTLAPAANAVVSLRVRIDEPVTTAPVVKPASKP